MTAVSLHVAGRIEVHRLVHRAATGDGYPGMPPGVSAVTRPCGTAVYGHGGLIAGTWSYLYGTRDGGLIAVQNVNGDRGAPFPDPSADVLDAAFRPVA
ncbi:hypothetical protein GCM10010466_35320 [Planomonospora alba]|uniref:Uncharacterized protein n=1 Tax=Planomonospora alba TaxID=161354 RepID=A0ABP6N9Y9_9ACTN